MGEKKIEVIRRKSTIATPAPTRSVDEVKAQIVQCLELALKNILACPNDLKIVIEEGDRTTVFELDIAQNDFGRLLGAKGKTIGALRTIVMAMASVHQFRAVISIKDEGRFF